MWQMDQVNDLGAVKGASLEAATGGAQVLATRPDATSLPGQIRASTLAFVGVDDVLYPAKIAKKIMHAAIRTPPSRP